MGENAKKTWDWHNTVVGSGYQAKGVVRQRVSEQPAPVKVIDMRAPEKNNFSLSTSKINTTVKERKEDKKHKKKKKDSKEKRKKYSDSEDSSEDDHRSKRHKSRFDPILQALSVRLRDNLEQNR